jgi:hypothetical protein
MLADCSASTDHSLNLGIIRHACGVKCSFERLFWMSLASCC